LKGIANLILILAALNLFQGCAVFRSIEKSHATVHRINKYIEDGKYFILYSKNGTHHLSDIKLINNNLTGRVSELSAKHLQYRIPPGEKPSEVSEEERQYFLRKLYWSLRSKYRLISPMSSSIE